MRLSLLLVISPVAVLFVGCCCLPSPEEEAARLTKVKQITLQSGGWNDAGQPGEQVVLDSPEGIARLLATIKFVRSPRSCCCLYSRKAIFRTDREGIEMTIGPHQFFLVYGKRTNGFVMPRAFYTLFESHFGREPAEYKDDEQ